MDVGIRELKEHLSEYLERVARGEVIRVTDRGQPRAILAPLPGLPQLEGGIEAGWIRPPKSQEPPRPVARRAARRTVADVTGEDRGA